MIDEVGSWVGKCAKNHGTIFFNNGRGLCRDHKFLYQKNTKVRKLTHVIPSYLERSRQEKQKNMKPPQIH